MAAYKYFTLNSARKMLPQLRRLLSKANDELDELSIKLESAHEAFRVAEDSLIKTKPVEEDVCQLERLRQARKAFEEAISALSLVQGMYVDCLNDWLEKISATGVILRDLRSGLIDFPARQGSVDYYLCWRLGEKDIDFWHLENDGFQGRRPLAVLDEYF